MKNIKIVFLLFAISIVVIACSTSSLKNAKEYSVNLIGQYEFKTRTAFNGTLLGGLSGLTYDKETNRFYAISDDRGEKGKPRFYEFRADFDAENFKVIPLNVTFLKNKKHRDFRVGKIDFEGISLLKNGNLLISSEGDQRLKKRVQPEIQEYNKDGAYIKSWPVPDAFKFEQTGKITKGIRINKGFESLSTTDDFIYTFTANENTLLQDGDESTQDKMGLGRIIRYRHGKVDGIYAIDIDSIPNPENFKNLKGDNGIVDMIAIDKDNLIVMERAWVSNNKKNTIKLFHVNLSDATDISDKKSLANGQIKTVNKGTKKLLLDFDAVVGKMSLDSQALDNIEGITLGPRLINGNQSIVVVSDNNFSKYQRTLFLAFEINSK